eukprot:jgi/Antlo1/132/1161
MQNKQIKYQEARRAAERKKWEEEKKKIELDTARRAQKK